MHILFRTPTMQQQYSRGSFRSLKTLRLPIASQLRFNYFSNKTKRLSTLHTVPVQTCFLNKSSARTFIVRSELEILWFSLGFGGNSSSQFPIVPPELGSVFQIKILCDFYIFFIIPQAIYSSQVDVSISTAKKPAVVKIKTKKTVSNQR